MRKRKYNPISQDFPMDQIRHFSFPTKPQQTKQKTQKKNICKIYRHFKVFHDCIYNLTGKINSETLKWKENVLNIFY